VKRRVFGWRTVTRPCTRETTTVLPRRGLSGDAKAGVTPTVPAINASAVRVTKRSIRGCLWLVVIVLI
jgi:hypothetical protein